MIWEDKCSQKIDVGSSEGDRFWSNGVTADDAEWKLCRTMVAPPVIDCPQLRLFKVATRCSL